MLPRFVITFDVPSRAEDLTQRLHNKFAKEAVREALEEHWRKNQPKHFEPGNAARYGHHPRHSKYLERKRRKFGHAIDLVYSGRSKRRTRRAEKITVGGNATAGTLRGVLVTRFAFGGGTGRAASKGSNARVQQMIRELESWTDAEGKEAAADFLRRYMAKVDAHRGSRKRKRIVTK